jgi:threonine dehydrogenase-like Zn-dependent dehydrogenase
LWITQSTSPGVFVHLASSSAVAIADKLRDMRTARAAVMPAPNQPIEIRDVVVPELEVDSALMRVTYSEVCGTDVHLQQGRLAGVPYPLIPGHVSAGVIDKLRGRMVDIEGRPLREGQLITFLDVHRTCGQCWYCLVAKASTRCPQRKVYGITYGVADGCAGGWCDFVYLRPGTRILPLEGVSPERFMAGGCGLPTAVHAIERAQVALADTVLVLGSGPVGLSAIALARACGAARVLCIGGPERRLKVAQSMGAADVYDITQSREPQAASRAASPDERHEWVRSHTAGRGADVVIEATGSPQAVTQAMQFARDAGRVVIVGQYTDAGDARFNPHTDLNRKHLEVRASWGCDFSHVHRALEYLRFGQLAPAWDCIELERFVLEQAQRALDAVARGSVVKALISPALTGFFFAVEVEAFQHSKVAWSLAILTRSVPVSMRSAMPRSNGTSSDSAR